MINNYDEMLRLKAETVVKKQEIVIAACERLANEKRDVTYKAVSELTGIPLKTLEDKKYSILIKKHKYTMSNVEDKEKIQLKEKIKYLYSIIDKLNRENNNLKTLLLDEKI